MDFAAQAKLARFVSAGAPALYTAPFGFNLGDARDRSFDRQRYADYIVIQWTFFRPVGAQSTAHLWHTDPLTPYCFIFEL